MNMEVQKSKSWGLVEKEFREAWVQSGWGEKIHFVRYVYSKSLRVVNQGVFNISTYIAFIIVFPTNILDNL